ncbi:MAG: hypothetical protein IIC67_00175 [Thaumarchaeota archaeon]|nr:hypothetical protein [Nitrososphaerota archaeon]
MTVEAKHHRTLKIKKQAGPNMEGPKPETGLGSLKFLPRVSGQKKI